ncbi:MAG: hypothetical protein EZS26_001913 [Candidatus Ordinivivax streblomastigis]|uniref:T9SS type A sorting domain-containing protein n=1 Tax=Candidatus Ordinivivax streblomastigis TaxID=2540710 RepID=A0A5M8P0P3_9BACT|nr:MAG: hypothetical protein EZS26_001913 [Candidatus Ordinivivax streblomastigis]
MEIKRLLILISLIGCFSLVKATDYTYSNNWYVGDTEQGEWIKHKKIHIAEGDYRFTTRAIAPTTGKTLALALNDNIAFTGIEVPADKTGKFQLVHLGSKHLAAGYYDIKLIFETGDVNCDMIFIKKDARTDNAVLDTDIEYSLNHTDGMHISPIAGASGGSSVLAKSGDPGDNIAYYFHADPGNGMRYTREQVMQWNKQPLYTFHLEYTQEAMDILVQEFAESKVDFIWAHGRGEPDAQNEIIDRDFKDGAGGMPCRGLSILADAIKRNPYAKNNLKVAYFFDSAASFTSAGLTQFYNGSLDYRNDDFRNFMWEFAVKKWYQTIPHELLFTLPDTEGLGRTIVPMQWWTCGVGSKWGDRNIELTGAEGFTGFFNFLKEKMESEFGITPAWILDQSFFDRGGQAARNIAWGTQAWFIWGQGITDIRTFNGKKFAFALNGGRIPIYEAVQNDWNPYTDAGTFTGDNYNQIRTKGYHTSALDANGEPVIRSMYERGTNENAEWLVLESWFDWYEGSTWYRSGHREYAYPNQHLNLCREFADKETTSILLEAESCDEFFDKSSGNSGGAYRLDWYKTSELQKDYWDANLEADIDIFRPLHQLSDIELHTGSIASTPNKIEAGYKDVWVLAGKNNSIYANEIDGYPVARWDMATNNNYLSDLTLGGYSAWGITTTGRVVRSSLPSGQKSNKNDTWQQVDGEMTIVDIDANNAMVWGVDNQSNIYYRNFAATRPWVKIEGKLTSIAVDELFGWGFAPDGTLKRFSLQSKSDWKIVPNPHHLTHLSANCEEVWGVNAQNEVYRISSSGYGDWEFVADGYKDVSVGTNFVWFLDTNDKPYKCELNSFTEYSAFTLPNETGIIYSDVNKTSVAAYPNPFADRLTLTITSRADETIQLCLRSIDGKTIYRNTVDVETGRMELNLESEIRNLPPGIYLLSIGTSSGKEVIKIVKR